MRTRLLVTLAAAACLWAKPAAAAVVGDLTGPTADQLRGAASADADPAENFDGDGHHGPRGDRDGGGSWGGGHGRGDRDGDGERRRERRPREHKAPPAPSEAKPSFTARAMSAVMGDKDKGTYEGGMLTMGALGGFAGIATGLGALGLLGGVGAGALLGFLIVRFLF